MEELERAVVVIEAYRASFSYPLLKVRIGLESFVRTRGYPEAGIAQRLKRHRRMISKLVRHHGMQITTMQDIGGCRVVLPHLDAVYELNNHIGGQWGGTIVNVHDYIAHPPESGYQAVHVVVERDDRLIEVQLRSERQHRWADYVEEIGRDIGHELKSGEGPAPVLKFLALLADAMALRDRASRFQRSWWRRSRGPWRRQDPILQVSSDGNVMEERMAVERNVHLLLVYSTTEHRLIDRREFVSEADEVSMEAVEAYGEAERKYADDPSIEVVLITASSSEVIEHTHSSYFKQVKPAAEVDLESLLA